MQCAAELATAARHRIPLLVLLLNDAAYGMEYRKLTDFGDDLDSVGTEVIVLNLRDGVMAQLARRLRHGAADVWTPGAGLGHHAARVRSAALDGSCAPARIAAVTDYSQDRLGTYTSCWPTVS